MSGLGSKGRRDKRDPARVGGTFIAMPHSVMESAAYLSISHTSRSLLFELALQYRGQNNGRLLLCMKKLAKRGWSSPEVIQRAKKQLLERELIFETVKGHRPNKASWYAVTWLRLDIDPRFDPGIRNAFKRGAFQAANAGALTSADVAAQKGIATSGEAGVQPHASSDVAMQGPIGTPATTSDVVHLEKPSARNLSDSTSPAGAVSAPTFRTPREIRDSFVPAAEAPSRKSSQQVKTSSSRSTKGQQEVNTKGIAVTAQRACEQEERSDADMACS